MQPHAQHVYIICTKSVPSQRSFCFVSLLISTHTHHSLSLARPSHSIRFPLALSLFLTVLTLGWPIKLNYKQSALQVGRCPIFSIVDRRSDHYRLSSALSSWSRRRVCLRRRTGSLCYSNDVLGYGNMVPRSPATENTSFRSETFGSKP